VRDTTVTDFLDALASDAPAPGGGAAVGVSVALGAALAAMVCRLTLGKKAFEPDARFVQGALTSADELNHLAVTLAEDDARAFGEVSSAYRLPRSSDEERLARHDAIQRALVAAAEVPLAAAEAAHEVARLAESLVGRSNPRVASDLGVAAACARAGVVGAALNVHVNTALLDDRGAADDLDRRVDVVLRETIVVAERVVQRVESSVAGS
jgi:formiminotetrahydrofolate cyclodeaminase